MDWLNVYKNKTYIYIHTHTIFKRSASDAETIQTESERHGKGNSMQTEIKRKLNKQYSYKVN